MNAEQLRTIQLLLAQDTRVDRAILQPRIERLGALIEELDIWKAQAPKLISQYLQHSEEGRERVRAFLEANKSGFLAALEKEADELKTQIQDLQDEKAQIENDIAEREGERQSLDQIGVENIEALKIPQEEITRRTEELSKLYSAESLHDVLTILRHEENQAKDRQAQLKAKNSELQKLQDQLAADVKRSQDKLRERLRELKPYVDLLSGVVTAPEPISKAAARRSTLSVVPEASELVTQVKDRLSSAGRELRFVEVANLLALISQNLLTVFAGLPGVGKTSLVCHLAQALGLGPREFLVIPVARGWTSSRDLLGYFNPLSERFQASSTGLFGFLQQQDQVEENGGRWPAWVLLDEANLSPMEHYWSGFIAHTDGEAPKRIRTGANGAAAELRVPAPLRFLATINYDHTTEPLSPRLLDRTAVVSLEPPPSGELKRAKEPMEQPETCVDWGSLSTAFQASAERSFTEDEQRIHTRLYEHLADPSAGGLPTILSPRKRLNLEEYVSRTRSLMRDDHPLCALDFGLAQFVVPCLNGRGSAFGTRLRRVADSLPATSLPRTREQLERLITRGEAEHHNYSFFSWV